MHNGRVTVYRFNPEIDSEPRYETYDFPYTKGMSVLDVALYIYEQVDSTFSFSYCCRNSHCGLCGAQINGKPGLMCRESASPELLLEPLKNLTIIRDLMVDRQEYEERKSSLRLFIERVEVPEQKPEKVCNKDQERFKVASRCVECYSCLSVCPVLRKNKHEYLGPAGFVQLARHTFDPRDELNREVMAYSAGIYNCTTCGKCDTVCPHEIAPSENIELMRGRLIERGNAPRAINQLIDLVKKTKKALIPQKGKKSLLEQTQKEPVSKVGLFVGCNFDYDTRLMPTAFAAVKVLQKMGVDLYIPQDQVCCGTPLKEIGAINDVKELVLENVKAFETAGCSQILTLCSGCGLSMKKVWPELFKEETGKDLPFTVKDFSEFVVEMGLPEYLNDQKMTVTYHDPCSLKRGQGISEEPRQIIKSIPGLQLVEMLSSDECCGAGGGLRVTNFPLSQQITERKVTTVKNLGVDAVVTGCPTCIKQLTMVLSQQRLRNISVIHPAVLMAQSMGIEI
jgi:fumarate reductase (CoM/CoB) subunit B